jgi:hypothetical protein
VLVISKFLTIIAVSVGVVRPSFGYYEHFNGMLGFPVAMNPCGNTDDMCVLRNNDRISHRPVKPFQKLNKECFLITLGANGLNAVLSPANEAH